MYLMETLHKFWVGKVKVSSITSHPVLKIVPKASHIYSHPFKFNYNEACTCLLKCLFSLKGEKKFVNFQLKLGFLCYKRCFFNTITSSSETDMKIQNYWNFKLHRVSFKINLILLHVFVLYIINLPGQCHIQKKFGDNAVPNPEYIWGYRLHVLL